jgi:hypothetical protein
MSVKSIWSVVCSVILFWSFFVDFFVVRVGHWSHPLLLCWGLSVLLCPTVAFVYEIGCADIWYVYVYNCYLLLMFCSLYQYEMTFLVSSHLCCCEVCFIKCEYSFLCLLLGSICLGNLFLSFHTKPIFVFAVRFISLGNKWTGLIL